MVGSLLLMPKNVKALVQAGNHFLGRHRRHALGVSPSRGAAIEDSTNGLLVARAAGMRVVAVPRVASPPDPESLATADAVVPAVSALAIGVIDPGGSGLESREDAACEMLLSWQRGTTVGWMPRL